MRDFLIRHFGLDLQDFAGLAAFAFALGAISGTIVYFVKAAA